MARSVTPTKLPLDEWARILGIHPLHFNQVQLAAVANSICEQAWFSHEWQDSDRVGREAIAEAISQAEQDIEALLKFRLVPAWERDEWQPTVRPIRAEFVNLSGSNVRGFRAAVQADWGHFIAGGIEAWTLLQTAQAIGWTNVTGALDDTAYKETGTVTAVVPAGTEPCEVALYYPGKSGDPAWEIRPIAVSITGVNATITFRRELAVLETFQEEHDPSVVDGLVDSNFLATVDVYRHWNDPQTNATLVWEPLPTCSCNDSSCPSCSLSVQTACIFGRGDPRLSVVAFGPADWDAASDSYTPTSFSVGRNPDVVRLYYYAGLRDKGQACANNVMDREWARAVAFYAASLLDRPLCDCTVVKQQLERYSQDLAFQSGADETGSYQISSGDLDCPLGTRRGALLAWKRIADRATGESVAL